MFLQKVKTAPLFFRLLICVIQLPINNFDDRMAKNEKIFRQNRECCVLCYFVTASLILYPNIKHKAEIERGTSTILFP